jgi:hypothetical protein
LQRYNGGHALIVPNKRAFANSGLKCRLPDIGIVCGLGLDWPIKKELALDYPRTQVYVHALIPLTRHRSRRESGTNSIQVMRHEMNSPPQETPPGMPEADPKRQARQLRNRKSAQDSRDRKRKYLESLELANEELLEQNANLMKRLKKLEYDHMVLMERLMGDTAARPSTISPAMPSSIYFASPIESVPSQGQYEHVSTVIASSQSEHPHAPHQHVALSTIKADEENVSDESAELVHSSISPSSRPHGGHPSSRPSARLASASWESSRRKDSTIILYHPQQSDLSSRLQIEKALPLSGAMSRRLTQRTRPHPYIVMLLPLTPSLVIPITLSHHLLSHSISTSSKVTRASLLLSILQLRSRFILYYRMLACVFLTVLYARYYTQRHQI